MLIDCICCEFVQLFLLNARIESFELLFADLFQALVVNIDNKDILNIDSPFLEYECLFEIFGETFNDRILLWFC